jgi:plasmid stabilization system protein ParE
VEARDPAGHSSCTGAELQRRELIAGLTYHAGVPPQKRTWRNLVDRYSNAMDRRRTGEVEPPTPPPNFRLSCDRSSQ